jgi:polyphosphate kinase
VKLVQPDHIEELLDLFTSAMGETVASWHLNQDGSWTRHQFDKTGGKLIDLQDHLMNFVAGRKVSTR